MPGGALEDQPARGLAPAQLDHLVLAADRIGAAVQHVRDGQAAGQVAIDRHVGGIEHVFDAGHRAHRGAAFVDRVGGDVRVRVDDAGRDEAALGFDDVGAGGIAVPDPPIAAILPSRSTMVPF